MNPLAKAQILLNDPFFNKSSAFTLAERRKFGLEGVLPAGYNTQSQQAQRIYQAIHSLADPLAQYLELTNLQDRNEYLFYRLLMDNLEEFIPIIYTPTVGKATQQFSGLFRRSRGLWITPDYQGRIKQVIAGAFIKEGSSEIDQDAVSLLVVTDNEAILGIGDQGAGGIAISIGKLSLYTACAGIDPQKTLPISLDVGTNNVDLLNNPLYLGWPHKRLRGARYWEILDEFVNAIKELFPQALIQWEDFRNENALKILQRYRQQMLSFNDDIQGTGAVVLAGLFSALRICKQPLTAQRIVIYGAGAAGLGIASQIKSALALLGVAENDLMRSLALLDSKGLITADRLSADDPYKRELAWSEQQAQEFGFAKGEQVNLLKLVENYRPTILIGSSGQAGSFNKKIVEAMCLNNPRPIIMPLSNPTDNCEALPADVIKWSKGQALIATGSPFAPVNYGGRDIQIGQGNNAFIFPALGLAALSIQSREVSDAMCMVAAQTLGDLVTAEEHAAGLLYPKITRLRAVTAQIAAAVAEQAIKEGNAQIKVKGDMLDYIKKIMWSPDYPEFA